MPSPASTSSTPTPAGGGDHLDLVRFRNDGDDFHVLWTARRALKILWPDSGLVAVAVEGISERDRHQGRKIEAGLLVADTVEYYGGESFEQARQIVVNQLKYSTTSASQGWPASGVEETLAGFAERYRALVAAHGKAEVSAKCRFRFITNRPLSAELQLVLAAARRNNGRKLSTRARTALLRLKSACALKGAELKRFLKIVDFVAGHASRFETAGELGQAARQVQPGLYAQATAGLKEMVRSKAVSEEAADPTIRRETVLRAFGVEDERDLFPAPAQFDSVPDRVAHHQEPQIAAALVGASGPLLIAAPGGVGKSALAQHVPDLLPAGSEAVVFDGFAGGTYRSPSQARHLHGVGLVQIANELAARGLCDPLLPVPAQPHDYVRAFRHRLAQAAETVVGRSPEALVTIVLDAADNIQMGADLAGDRSFVRDLVQEAPPQGCRIVFLARPERVEKLRFPETAERLELEPFSPGETAALVRRTFPEAGQEEVEEFHRLTFGNPRVQANQLAASASVAEAVARLGPHGQDVEGLIAQQLDTALGQLRAAEPEADLDTMCAALAMLPPLVPVAVVAQVANVDPGAILSFAADFAGGRPLLVHGAAVQFRDEPVEHWFQKRFAPSPEQARAFSARLEPLARTDGYAAMALPGLLHAAQRYDELLELALSGEAFETPDPVEKRHVVLARVKFALKAAFARGRLTDVAKLLVRAGEEAAASERQSRYLTDNADLVARLCGPQVVDDFVFRRRAGGGAWYGSSNAYNAAMLAADASKLTEARAYLRLAERWLDEWIRLPDEEKLNQPLEAQDLAAMAFATAICDGAQAAALFLRRARRDRLAFDVASAAAEQLLDAGRDGLLLDLLGALGDAVAARMGCIAPMWHRRHDIPVDLLTDTAGLLIGAGELPSSDYFEGMAILEAAVSLAEALARAGHLEEARSLCGLIDLPVPQHPFPDFRGRLPASLRLALLREGLGGTAVDADHLWQAGNPRSGDETASHTFKAMAALLIPFFRLRTRSLLHQVGDFDAELEAAERQATSQISFAGDYRDREIRSFRFIAAVEAMAWAGMVSADRLAKAERGLKAEGMVWLQECIRVTVLISREAGLAREVLRYADMAVAAVEAATQDAGSAASDYARIARALVSTAPEDAAVYFNNGVEIADRVGDELHDRLWMLLGLAERGAEKAGSTAQDVFRLLRAAELFSSINDHKFPWHDVFETLALMHGPSAIAGASRLDNRKTTSFDRTLAAALEALSKQGAVGIAAKAALNLLDAYWSREDLAQALGDVPPHQRSRIVAYLAGDALHFDQEGYRMGSLVEAARAHALLDPHLEATYDERRRHDGSGREWTPSPTPPPPPFDFDTILAAVDLTDGHSISDFLDKRVAEPEAPSLHELLQAMRARVPPGQWSAHVRALAATEALGISDLTSALEAAAADWEHSPAVKAQVARAAVDTAKSRALELAGSSYYWTSYLPRLSALSGRAAEEMTRLVLENAGGSVEHLGSGSLFSLARRVGAALLTPEAAREVCRFALDRLQPVLRDEDGDGPWDAAFKPPDSVPASIAGLLWVQLGAPEADQRWRAAHSVRRLAALGQQEIVDGLVAYAQGRDVAPFVDRALPFYEKHAQLFLAIALARAAMEAPASVAPYESLLRQWSFRANPHLFLRHHSGRALLALAAAGAIDLDDSDKKELELLLSSAFPPSADDPRPARGAGSRRDRDEYLLPFDFEKNTSGPLATAFGLAQADVEERVVRVLVDEWKVSARGEWKADPRAARGYYRDRGRPRSNPVHTLNEYQAFHAAAVTAGRLLDERGFAASYGAEMWKHWSGEQLLTMPSGLWLADRRDPTPLPKARWDEGGGSDRDWMWMVRAEDFEERLFAGDGELIAWGDWTEARSSRYENVTIESALVSPATAGDLLRSAQTSEYRWGILPFAGSDAEIRRPGFRLTGWVAHREGAEGIDAEDPLSGRIHFPPLGPGESVRRLLKLEPDPDERLWVGSVRPELRFKPRVWGDPLPRMEEDEPPVGRTLQVPLRPLLQFLAAVGRDLIIVVQIRRRDRWAGEKGFDYVRPYFRFFLLRGDGRLEWFRGGRRVGEEAG
jgi:NACHT domain-containing protein